MVTTVIAVAAGVLLGWALRWWVEGRWQAHRRAVAARPPRSSLHRNPRSPRLTDRNHRP